MSSTTRTETCDNIAFSMKLMCMTVSNDYTEIKIKVRINHKLNFKDTYSLTCKFSNDNIIKLILANRCECEKTLSIDIDELIRLLVCNGYDAKYDSFKMKENAKNVANYINVCILLHQLKM